MIDLIAAIGNTPLVKLRKAHNQRTEIFGKLEYLNPNGSIKDRTALAIIDDAMLKGYLHQGCSVVESSSGNMAIALAQICAYHGMTFTAVIDPKANRLNLKILQSYGANIEMVDQPLINGGWLGARVSRVKEMIRSNPDLHWTNQYQNQANRKAHFKTMEEIAIELNHQVDYIFVSTSTCGTLMGCHDYITDAKMNTRIVAVDAMGSAIFNSEPRERLIPGHGASTRSYLLDFDAVYDHILVSDGDCVRGCKMLMEEQTIFAGGSSGGVYLAATRYLKNLPSSTRSAMIFCDRGERYLDTVYNDEWVLSNIPNDELHGE